MAHADDYDQRAEHDHRRSHGTDRTTKTRKQKVAKIEISNSSAHTGNPRSEPATPCLNVEKRKALMTEAKGLAFAGSSACIAATMTRTSMPKLTATAPIVRLTPARRIAMSDIDRLLFATTGLALAALVLLDDTFSVNLFRAIGGEIPTLSLNPWAASLGAIFLMLAAIAIYKERSRK